MELPESQIGTLMAPFGNWAACVRIVEPITKETLDIFELENNEHAVSIALVNFTGTEETLLVVGSVKDYRIGETKSFSDAFITTFLLSQNGKKLEILHKT